MADQVGDGVRLPGTRRALDGDTAMLGEARGDLFLLGISGQRHEQPFGGAVPAVVAGCQVLSLQLAGLVCHHRNERRGYFKLPGVEGVRSPKKRRYMVARRRTARTQVALIVGAPVGGGGIVASSTCPSWPSGGSNFP